MHALSKNKYNIKKHQNIKMQAQWGKRNVDLEILNQSINSLNKTIF